MNFIKFEQQGHIGIISLNRPKVNSLSLAMYGEIRELFEQVDQQKDIWVVILTTTSKHFCAGNDISEFDQFGPSYVKQIGQAIRAAFLCQKPVICALQGAVMGAGIAFGCAGDIVLCAEDTKFSIAEANVGLCGTLSEASKLFPVPFIRYMALTGNVVPAEEAARFGGIYKVVPNEALQEEALSIANTICSKAPLSIQRTKEALQNISHVYDILYKTAPFEYDSSLLLAHTDDHKEASIAFAEKRVPVFHGK